MKISKVKIWLEVHKEIVMPLKKAREIILSEPNKENLANVILILENIASKTEELSSTIDKVAFQNNPTRYREYELFVDMYIEYTNELAERYKPSIQYYNYIIDIVPNLIGYYLKAIA